MLTQILNHTPTWVFAVLGVLLWQGINQMRPRTVGIARSTLVPLAMTALSLYGVISVFGDNAQSMLTWVVGAALAFTAYFQLASTSQIQYDATTRCVNLPGSAVPLFLFMGIFITKYAVGISIHIQPALAHDNSFVLGIGMLFSVFSGVFLARAAQLWRVVMARLQADARKTSLA